MDIKNKIKPATLEEAFEISNSTSIIGNDITELELRNVSRNSIRDIFLDDNESFEDAVAFYPSKMNTPEQTESESSTINNKPESLNVVQASFMSNSKVQTISHTPVELFENGNSQSSPFIVANTEEVSLQHLKNDCIIPVFRDSEQTIAHFQLINTVQECIAKAFPYHSSDKPEIRVSHKVSGRIPEALHKPVKELLDNEKTLFWERMAFIIRIPSITDIISGNELSLTIGGIRSYKSSNLFNKKSMEHFKVFCGFQVKVCSNLCVWSDGFVDDLRASSVQELQTKILQLLQNYNAEKHLSEMKSLIDYSLTESQFASLIGRSRLYQHLPKSEKQNIPLLNFNDSHINTMAKDYYEDKNFCRQEDGNINLWSVYNLFTQANKSSYIDTFLDRNLNAFEFSKGVQKALNGSSDYHWFLS